VDTDVLVVGEPGMALPPDVPLSLSGLALPNLSWPTTVSDRSDVGTMQYLTRPSGSPPARGGLVDLLADLAGLGTAEEASGALPELLGMVSDQTGAAACQLDAATTTTQKQAADIRFHTVANIG
jgi:hypothetical protein